MTRTLFVDLDAPTSEPAAAAFLATFEARPSIRRSLISRLYIKAGRPGGLTLEQLHELAAQRWPSRAANRPTYLPARASR